MEEKETSLSLSSRSWLALINSRKNGPGRSMDGVDSFDANPRIEPARCRYPQRVEG